MICPSMGLGLHWHSFSAWLGTKRSNRRAFQEFSRSLALIVDREALAASVAARVRELFDPDRLLILEPGVGTASFLPVFSYGFDRSRLAGAEVPVRGKLARWLLANETCLFVHRQPGVYEYLDASERELLDRLDLDLCVPMISINRLTGILLLGTNRPSWRLRGSQVELLSLLASQASLAFENAALYGAQRERLDRLYRAERLAAVGQLAAGVAHEIRNPLTAIRSTMQYLLRGLDSTDSRHQLVKEILSEVDRINSTVGGLLSLSRSGERHHAEMDLRGPLGSAVQLVQSQAADQRVGIASLLGERPWGVLGDAGQLKQVFLNLLMNAIQSMPEGGRIDVRVEAWSPAAPDVSADWVEVRIADTGPGIAPEQMRRIFDPFFTTKREGTGLGLAICHGIIEQHGGEISMASEVGRGTNASVRLPLIAGGTWRPS